MDGVMGMFRRRTGVLTVGELGARGVDPWFWDVDWILRLPSDWTAPPFCFRFIK